MAKEINMTDNQPEKIDITILIDDAWRGFKKLWLVGILLIVLCSGAFGYLSKRSYSPNYMAYTTFVVKSYSIYEDKSTNYYSNARTAQMAETFPYLLKCSTLRHRVAESLGESSFSETIQATATSTSSPLFTISVYSSDPQRAYTVLQAVIENYPAVAEYVIGETEMTIMDESGVPDSPVNVFNMEEALVKGAFVGGILALGLIALYALTRKTVRRESDLKRHLSLINLGNIPGKKLKIRSRKANKRIVFEGTNSDESYNESISGVRGRIIREAKKTDARVLLITSAMAGEGKSTVAANLAISLAKKKKRVILMDGDLRNPTQHKIFDIEPESNAMEKLLTRHNLKEVKCFTYRDLPLMILPAAPVIKGSRMEFQEKDIYRVVKELRKICDYIIIDTPPCGMISDTAAFAHVADAAVLVVRQDYTPIDKIIFSAESLSDCGIRLLGYVFNFAAAGITSGYYGSGYGYGYGYGYGRGYGYGNKHHYGYGKFDDLAPDEEETK